MYSGDSTEQGGYGVSGRGEQDQCLPPTVEIYKTSNNEENGGRPMNNWGICEAFIIDGPGEDSRVGSGDGPSLGSRPGAKNGLMELCP